LVEDNQVDAAGLEVVRPVDDMFNGSAEPVEFRDHELAPGGDCP